MIKSFAQISKHERDLVGGKAYSQALLWQKKFNVPAGLVITANAFEAFLQARSLRDTLNLLDQSIYAAAKLYAQIEQADLHQDLALQLSNKVSEIFPDTYPHGFAVRSSALGEDSAEHSFAGIHRTLLGVTRDKLPRAILSCWASAFAPPAIDYRRERGLSLSQIRIAVLIQPLLIPYCAGVAFTLDPVSGNRDEIVINATYGLGEMLVSGQVEPDLYRLRKGSPLLIQEQYIGTKAEQLNWYEGRLERTSVPAALRGKAALNSELVLGLGHELQRIEEVFGAPQDVEWAYDGNRLFILQARPITTTAPTIDFEWSRVNFREIVPDLPSPCCCGLFKLSEPDFAAHYRAGGFKIDHLRPILKVIYGRPYFNLTIMKYTTELVGMPLDTMLRAFGHGAELDPHADYSIKFRKLLANFPLVVKAAIWQMRNVPNLEKFIDITENELSAYRMLDVDQVSYTDIATLLEQRRHYFCNFLYNAMS
ncbi:MAG: PEP/pyruvate-binding domain-containing protein, partial [Acidobacteriota bacterium]